MGFGCRVRFFQRRFCGVCGWVSVALLCLLSTQRSRGEEDAVVPSLIVFMNDGEYAFLSAGTGGVTTLNAEQQRALSRLPWVPSNLFAPGATVPEVGPLRFVSPTGQLLAVGATIPAAGVRLLPTQPGAVALRLAKSVQQLSIVELQLMSQRNGTMLPRHRLSLSRVLPAELALQASSAPVDEEAVRVRLVGPASALPSALNVTAFFPDRSFMDTLSNVPLRSAECVSADLLCAETEPLRLVPDTIERNHPAIVGRSLMAQVGGEVELRLNPAVALRLLVAAPDGVDPSGAAPGRYKLRLRTRLINMQPGGPPPVGNDNSEAVKIVSDELDAASRVWGQCGIVLGPRDEWDIQVVDPPQLTLLEVGCRGALLASGGTVAFEAGKQQVRLQLRAGQSPRDVARLLAQRLDSIGLKTRVFRNAQVSYAALPSYDVLVFDRAGRPVALRPIQGQPFSMDPTLSVCQGKLDLADGLEHFVDFNAAAGTREERMLLRAFSDDDPTTIELIVVPLFAGVGRIGESFIKSPGGSLMNALILDRGGVRAGTRSLTLAHELGHILLEMPGHPDDFGVDTPSSLMDADASDATIFGPRRLTLEDCRRALIQNGPGAPTPVLEAWPLQGVHGH